MTKQLEKSRAYWIKWKARDIGYGVERGSSEYIYRGRESLAGKRVFDPVGGGETIYLFDDEIVYCEPESFAHLAD